MKSISSSRMTKKTGFVAKSAAVLVCALVLVAAPGTVRALRLEPGAAVVLSGTDSGLLGPSGLGYDRLRDRLLIADTENNRILLVDRQGAVVKTLGGGELSLPLAVAVNRGGTLFIAESNSPVLKILPAYDAQQQDDYRRFDLSAYGRSRPVRPVALFVAEDDTLYVCDRGNRQLLVFNSDRSLRAAIPKVGEPADVRVRGDRIYLADPGFGGIRVYNQKGDWQRTIGDSVAHFSSPLRIRALAVDRRERIWVLEESGAVRALDSLGNPLLHRGPAELFAPVDLALDNQDNLYVLERGGNRLTRFRISEF
jgi:DNA-binding beta-propeller fold protein YncE